MGLRFDVEKRLGSGVDATHATPASSGWPRRRIDTASRVSKIHTVRAVRAAVGAAVHYGAGSPAAHAVREAAHKEL